jgi:hypothetical protein
MNVGNLADLSIPGTATRRAFVGSVCAVFGLSATSAGEDGQDGADQQKESKERLVVMRRLARATRLSEVIDGEVKPSAPPRAEPLFRYSDPPRGIQDATLWAWGDRGRPIATMKVERWSNRRPEVRWNVGIVSLSTGRVEVKYSDGRVWASRKPGWVSHPFPDAPPPADSDAQRLAQMKELARRFTVSVHSVHNDNPLQLRLLPKPIDRYADPTSKILDGALFALAFGTNPTVLLAIEVDGTAVAGASWRYALARNGSGEMSALLDGKEVWSQPYALAPGDSDVYTNHTMPEDADAR